MNYIHDRWISPSGSHGHHWRCMVWRLWAPVLVRATREYLILAFPISPTRTTIGRSFFALLLLLHLHFYLYRLDDSRSCPYGFSEANTLSCRILLAMSHLVVVSDMYPKIICVGLHACCQITIVSNELFEHLLLCSGLFKHILLSTL